MRYSENQESEDSGANSVLLQKRHLLASVLVPSAHQNPIAVEVEEV